VTNRRWWGAAAVLLLLAALAGCGDGSAGPRGRAAAPAPAGQLTATPGVVRAGICPLDGGARSPLGQDRLAAFQDELLRRLGFKLALRMRVSTLPSCATPAAGLSDRTLDLVATAPNDQAADRSQTLATEPYLVVQYALVVRAGSPPAGAGLGGLGAGATVGVLAGTRGGAWAEGRLGSRGARVVPFADERAAAAALAAGGCDALLLPRAGAVRATRTVPGLRLGRLIDAGERATFLVAAANPALRRRVDRMLEEIVFDGSYAVIFDRHLSPTPVPIDFLPPD
jgi:ABC-type amino acid transport substrate-binding protein